MCKQVMHLTLLIAVVGIALGTTPSAAGLLTDPDIIGWWECNEGEGSVVSDSSPNGNDGTFVNGDPVWVPGIRGTAVELTIPTLVEIPTLNVTLTEATFAGWMKPYGAQPDWASFFMTRDGGTHGFNVLADFQLAYHWNDDSASWSYRGGDYIVDNEWTFAALTVTPSAATFFVNGVQGSTNSITHAAATFGQPLYLGGDGTSAQAARRMTGALDDMSFFGRALSPGEIMDLMSGSGDPAKASRPFPEDGADDVVRDVVLSWTPGEYAPAANGHKLFFSDVFADVNDGAPVADRGVVSDPSFDVTMLPFTLDYSTTYYWRIDEANSVTGWDIGDTWSFTTEPFAYPVSDIVVTTNTTSGAGQDPNNVINGSGLNANDEHSTNSDDMWSGSAPAGEVPYLQFAFARTYKLHEMLVWNYNHSFEMFLGVSVKDATIEYSQDGVEWTVLEDVVLPQGPGRATYTPGAIIEFGGVAVKFVRMTINSGYGTTPMVGLSEVRFTYIPAQAREPKPADGATNVSASTLLGWRGGRNAVSNDVYLGTDPNALAMAGNSAGASFNPGPLDLDTTYYWQVNANDGVDSWASDLWSFTTQPYLEIDGFESYTDDIDAGETIWQTWIDGIDDSTNGGAVVGYDSSPFAEMTTVRTDDQAMPFFFNNVGAAFSETDRTFSPAMDWSVSSIKSLTIWFHGAEGNTGNLYVKINNTKVMYDGDPASIAMAMWQPWNIDLSATGANLSNVSTLSIGVEGSGSGVVYIDDVRLYPLDPQLAEVAQPGTENLVAYYTFEGNVNDSSGHGHNGTIVGSPTYAAGYVNQAIALDGANDYVTVESVGIDPCEPRSIAGWVKADTVDVTAWTNIFGFTGPGTNGNHFDIECVGDSGVNATLGYYGLHRHGWERDIMPIDLEWHHLAATYDGTTISWFGDGQLVGSQVADETIPDVIPPGPFNMGKRQDNEVFFAGKVDEVRVYNVGLTPGEVAGLAGRTGAVHLPF